jgi:hypothetical protein
MSPRAIAALIWAGTSVVIAAFVVPVMVLSLTPSWAGWGFRAWVVVLIPNLLPILLPGGLSAAGYLIISARMRRD